MDCDSCKGPLDEYGYCPYDCWMEEEMKIKVGDTYVNDMDVAVSIVELTLEGSFRGSDGYYYDASGAACGMNGNVYSQLRLIGSENPQTLFAQPTKGTSSEAKKFDSGKPDLSLNPLVAVEQMARAFMLGEKKYGRYNYTAGMDASRLVGATLRHVHQWMDGEDTDAESGASHLGHALACLAMLLHQQQLNTLKDNRRKK